MTRSLALALLALGGIGSSGSNATQLRSAEF